MNVLQVSKFYPPVHGGIEAVARDISAGCRRHGAAVQVVCANQRPVQVDEVDGLGVRITRAASFGLLLSTSMAPALPWLLWRRRRWPDVVHVHMPDPLAALAVFVARPRAALVVHWHSDVVRQRFARHIYRPFEQWLLRRADAVIATSRDYADSSLPLARWHSKIEVVPVGVPPAQPPAADEVDRLLHHYGNRRLVLAVGRLTHYKGYGVLIDAAAQLPADVVVVIVGGGEGLKSMRERARRRGLAERVVFTGALSDARVERHFAAADVFCMPSTSRAEAYGVAALEAMARGLPVVASDIPGSGLGWLHQHGVTGLKVPAGNAAALAEALLTLLNDPALRARHGAAARARWADGLTAETMGERIVALYQRLQARCAPRATAPKTSTPT